MKKYLKFAVMAAFALVTVYNVHKVQTEVVLSDAQLENVEALATGETTPEGNTSCFLSTTEASDDDSLAVKVVSCNGCKDMWITEASEPGKCNR